MPGLTFERSSSSVAPTIAPARPMMSISRPDLSVTITRCSTAHREADPFRNFVHPADRGNLRHSAPPVIPLQHWSGLGAVGFQPALDRGRLIVAPAFDAAAFLDPRQNLTVG